MGRSSVGTWPPLQASQPELGDERPKKIFYRIFADNIVRYHPEDQSYQVWWWSDEMKRNYNTKCDFTIFPIQAVISEHAKKQVKIGLTHWSQKTFWLEMETCHFAHSRRKSWPTLKNFFEWWACTGKICGRLGSWPPPLTLSWGGWF